MAEFKPRSSEGGDDSEDKEGSFVQNWLEKMVADDEPAAQESDVDTKKKKRFGKLFKPVFRMLFPRNEMADGGDEEQPKRSNFGANILGVSKDVNPDKKRSDSHIPEVPSQDTLNIPHENPNTDIPERNLPQNETKPADTDIERNIEKQPDYISDEATQPTATKERELAQEITYTSSATRSDNRIDHSEPPVMRIEKSSNKNEVKGTKEPSVLAFIASEFSARRHRRKQEKTQKKLDKRQKQIEQEAKNTKLRLQANSKKIYETVKREIKQEIPKYIHENKVKLSQKENVSTRKQEVVVPIDSKIEQQGVQTKKSESTELIQKIEHTEIEKRELEKQEIERVINGSSEEIKKEEKTERYFETRQEVKDSSRPDDRAKYYSKPGQNKTHDPYDVQSRIGIPTPKINTNEHDLISTNTYRNKSSQTDTDSPKIITTVLLGIICALIIIKFFLA